MPVQPLSTGIDLYYEVHGEGEPLVLIPGTGFSADVWRLYQVPELAKSLQLVIFDPRGVGRSTHYDGVYTIDQQGCDVVALMDHLGIESAHVLGHSMGGRTVLWLALSFPRRVKSLMLAASGSGAGTEVVPGLPFHMARNMVTTPFENHLRHSFLESNNYFTAAFRRDHPGRVQAFYEVVTERHADFPEYLRQTMARFYWEATHRLGEVVVPTLVVVGDQDAYGMNHVEQAKKLHEGIPGAVLRVLKDASHGFFWEYPEETNTLILDWVRQHSGVR